GKGSSERETPLFQTMVVQDQADMGEDEVVYKELDDSLERVASTATSLDAEQDRGNINKTQSKTREERRSRTHRLKRLYKDGLSIRVESSKDEGLGEEDASKQGRIADIDANKDIYLVNVHTDKDMFGVNDLDGDEVIVESVDVVKTVKEIRSVVEEVIVVIEKDKLVSAVEETVNVAATIVSTASTILVSVATTTTTITGITDVEITLAQALAELKSAKPKADKVVIQEPEQGKTTTTTLATIITATRTRPKAKGLVIYKQEQVPTPTVSSQQPSQVKVQDKGKGKMVKPEPVKKLSKKDQLMLDEELAFKLQAKEEEEEKRLAREKAQKIEEVNIAWDDVQAKVEADYYNKRVNTFVDYRTELVVESSKKDEAEIAQESNSKRAREELDQESSKKQKVEEDKESEELKKCLEIVPDDGDDVTIDATPLSIKSPTIVDHKIYQEGKKSYFQIIRADLKARFKKTKLVNYMDNLLLHHLKTMFEHHVEDNSIPFYLLVEKIYPLTNHTLHQMFNDVKLQVDYECEMAFELLRLVKKQLKEDNNNSSTNGAVSITQAVNTANGVSATNTQVDASNIDNLSDAVICAFLASQLNNLTCAEDLPMQTKSIK
ncbi:hypothetical protein Tco_0384890, partial [Tanacetum coccineum]